MWAIKVSNTVTALQTRIAIFERREDQYPVPEEWKFWRESPGKRKCKEHVLQCLMVNDAIKCRPMMMRFCLCRQLLLLRMLMYVYWKSLHDNLSTDDIRPSDGRIVTFGRRRSSTTQWARLSLLAYRMTRQQIYWLPVTFPCTSSRHQSTICQWNCYRILHVSHGRSQKFESGRRCNRLKQKNGVVRGLGNL